MRSDVAIKKDVEDEIAWDPVLDAGEIVVAVKDGVVTLGGFVHSLTEKWEAESAATRVDGVLGVANDLEVRLPSLGDRPDPEIAQDAVTALLYSVPEEADNIKVVVKDGWATLDGEVTANHVRERAADAVRRVRGVIALTNLLKVVPRVSPKEIQRSIEEALARNARLTGSRIAVAVNGTEVVLTGTVRSWAERKEAELIAWRAPGVSQVDNRITIES